MNSVELPRADSTIDQGWADYAAAQRLGMLDKLARIDFAPRYEGAASAAEIEPGRLLANDVVLHAGTDIRPSIRKPSA